MYVFLYNVLMNVINYSSARQNFARLMDRVCDDHAPVVVTRKGEKSVVMLSLADFNSMEETAYLLRSPANAKRLIAAVKRLNAGKGKVRKLIE